MAFLGPRGGLILPEVKGVEEGQQPAAMPTTETNMPAMTAWVLL